MKSRSGPFRCVPGMVHSLLVSPASGVIAKSREVQGERQSTGMVANLQFCHDFPEIIKHFRRTKS